jgi:plasmid stabilization system protein ParE
MTYTVVWGPAAEDELAAMWLAAQHRDRITAMAAVIEGLLRADPEAIGESRSRNRRILLHGGLAVMYEVCVEDRIVRVLTVWLTR